MRTFVRLLMILQMSERLGKWVAALKARPLKRSRVERNRILHRNLELQVSWVRRQESGEKMSLLTVGQQTYTGDSRYTIEFQYPDNWRLRIKRVNSSDEGQYECQISTHPPKFIYVNLHINGKWCGFSTAVA